LLTSSSAIKPVSSLSQRSLGACLLGVPAKRRLDLSYLEEHIGLHASKQRPNGRNWYCCDQIRTRD
jgi:hypothetical protein